MFFDRFDMRDKETFFTNAERSLIAKYMLDKTSYATTEEKADVNMGESTIESVH